MGHLVLGCGVDIIEISRIARAIKRHRFCEKLFTAEEQELLVRKGVSSWAVRFAGKEAIMKALGCGWQRGVSFNQIEILPDKWGKPCVNLSDRAQEIAQEMGIKEILLSLSHGRDTAIAYAIAVGEE